MTDRTLLAVIPVRAGSKGVPRKNVALLGGIPMFAHTVRAVIASRIAERVVVSTDDHEVRQWCLLHQVEVHDRSADASGDHATIAQAVFEVVNDLAWSGDVAVLQVTSPLRSAASIKRAWDHFVTSDADSLMSTVRVPHMHWRKRGSSLEPLFSARVNRQQLAEQEDYLLSETGAIQFARSASVQPHTLVGEHHELFELPIDEALDIDTFDDLQIARRKLERLLIVFRFTANARVGSGHLHHVLQISELFAKDEVSFLLRDCDPFAFEAITAAGYAHYVETDLRRDLQLLAQGRKLIVVNDVLDTTENDLLTQRTTAAAVVCIEDLGAGPRFADLVINALYAPPAQAADRVRSGAEWATLRTEFFDLPDKSIREHPQRILVTFGGTDPSGLTGKFLPALAGLGVQVTVIVGSGNRAPIEELPGVRVVRNVQSMAGEMLDADVVVTSAGRTVYEAAATGTPVVVLAQNAREATHAHLGYESGTLFLGLGVLNEASHVAATVRSLLDDPALRNELSLRLRRGLDGFGSRRIASELRRLAEGFN